MTIESVQFFADPCCPWTWNTSRWLVEIAELAGVDIVWRTLCLAELNKDREVSEHFRPKLVCSRRMARLLEALRAEGRNEEMQAMFTAYGTRVHHDDHDPGDDLITACATNCRVDLAFTTDAINDASWDTGFSHRSNGTRRSRRWFADYCGARTRTRFLWPHRFSPAHW